MNRAGRTAVLAAAVASAGACASDGPTASSRLTIFPSSTMMAVGDTIRMAALVRPLAGWDLGVRARWQVSDPAKAAVDSTGRLIGLDTGRVVVRIALFDATAEGVVDIAPAVMVGAGDIAVCGKDADEETADLLAGTGGIVFTAGDNAYQDGTPDEFVSCYGPSWGRHLARTRPSPGNHDYHTAGAAGYFAYFGARAGPPGLGYYAYDLGSWRVYSLNSNVPMQAGSPQAAWLQGDLQANPRLCILAYWHHPPFSSGRAGSDPRTLSLLQVLFPFGVDVVIAGHDHHYERFALQDPSGQADTATGFRMFVVGTGGGDLFPLAPAPVANSIVRDNTSYGVIRLALYEDRYRWQFVRVDATVADSGTTPCTP